MKDSFTGRAGWCDLFLLLVQISPSSLLLELTASQSSSSPSREEVVLSSLVDIACFPNLSTVVILNTEKKIEHSNMVRCVKYHFSPVHNDVNKTY